MFCGVPSDCQTMLWADAVIKPNDIVTIRFFIETDSDLNVTVRRKMFRRKIFRQIGNRWDDLKSSDIPTVVRHSSDSLAAVNITARDLTLRFFELALVVVRLDHIASLIINPNHSNFLPRSALFFSPGQYQRSHLAEQLGCEFCEDTNCIQCGENAATHTRRLCCGKCQPWRAACHCSRRRRHGGGLRHQ
jgi:hypothetical protein